MPIQIWGMPRQLWFIEALRRKDQKTVSKANIKSKGENSASY